MGAFCKLMWTMIRHPADWLELFYSWQAAKEDEDEEIPSQAALDEIRDMSRRTMWSE